MCYCSITHYLFLVFIDGTIDTVWLKGLKIKSYMVPLRIRIELVFMVFTPQSPHHVLYSSINKVVEILL